MTRLQRLAIASTLCVLACGCDQASKDAAVFHLTEDGRATAPVEVVPGYFELQYRENPGAAFSMLAGVPASSRIPFFVLVGLLAIGAFAYRAAIVESTTHAIGAGLIMGGALGNLIDRVRFGYVVDFVHWHLGTAFDYPTFNIADAFILVGLGALVVGAHRASSSMPAAPA